MSFSDSILEAAIGLASINSLIEVDTERCVELNGGDLLVEKGKGQGCYRRPVLFIDKLRGISSELTIIEKNPREGDLAQENADVVLPEADVVGVTGGALTNHTMDHLLSICNPNTSVVVLGDTTPLSPVLFEYSVDAISGTMAVGSEQALRCVSKSANFRQMRGIRLLTILK